METRSVRWLGLIGLLAAVSCMAQEQPLSLTPLSPLTAVIGKPFSLQLEANGGVPMYLWRLVDSSLPPGLQLDSKTGRISGAPTSAGSFGFKVAVTDSAGPPATDFQTFTINVPDALTLDWKQVPHASKEGITGSVAVSNQTGHDLDLTVIIVVVNEVGKAFALAEQHFILRADSDSPTIPFGKDYVLPYGKYTLHADAVGEVASEKRIYRASQQPRDAFVIQQQ